MREDRSDGFGLDPSLVHYTSKIPDVRHRIIVNCEGMEKEGKTYWALGAPGKIIVLNCDKGLEGPVQAWRDKGKEIAVCGMPDTGGKDELPHYYFAPPPTKGRGQAALLKDTEYLKAVAGAARPVWKQVKDDYYAALNSKARSIVMDNGGMFWSLLCNARFGKTKQIPPLQRGQAKEEFCTMITDAQNFDKNVIWIHRLVPEWKGSGDNAAPTGQYRAKGYSELGYDVQANVRISRKKNGEYRLLVRDCRQNGAMSGEVLEGMEASFPFFAAAVFGTGVKEWM